MCTRPRPQPEGTRAPLYRFLPASHAHEYWNALNLSQFLERKRIEHSATFAMVVFHMRVHLLPAKASSLNFETAFVEP